MGDDGRPTSEAERLAEDTTGFSVLEAGVYYCTTAGELKLYDPTSGATETLRHLEYAVASGSSGCSVSPDGQWLLYTRQVRSGHDLMLLESVQ